MCSAEVLSQCNLAAIVALDDGGNLLLQLLVPAQSTATVSG